MEETLSYNRFISFHRNQINPEPHPKSTLTFAYGDQKYEKLTAEMQSDDDVLRKKALVEINEDFHQADKLNFALDSGILSVLVSCFTYHDDTIRELASKAVEKAACTEKGRQYIIDTVELGEKKVVPHISGLFDDSVTQIRSNAYHSLINVCEFTTGLDSVIDFGIIPVLVDKLVIEKEEEILILILKLIKILNEGELAPTILQNTPVIERLNKHLESTNAQIREMSAMNLGSLSYNLLGKEKCIQAGSIKPLSEMLVDQESDVRTAATRALCSLSQFKEGKVQIYDLDKINNIIDLLYDDSEQTRLNTVQMIAAISEYPPAREKFHEALLKLNQMVSSEKKSMPLVSKFAQVAIDVITWKP